MLWVGTFVATTGKYIENQPTFYLKVWYQVIKDNGTTYSLILMQIICKRFFHEQIKRNVLGNYHANYSFH